MSVFDMLGSIDIRAREGEQEREKIRQQLDAFTKHFGLKSLGDRMRIGLNEVGILAYDRTNTRVKEMIQNLVSDAQEADRVYQDLVKISVGIQESGPWGFAKELAHPESPEIKAWFMLTAAESLGYEREKNLNAIEFVDDVKRIEQHLQDASKDTEGFFQRAKEALLQKSEQALRFDEDDPRQRVPIGEGFVTFLPMVLKGYEAGVVHDAEGWVYVGARGEIHDALLESIGLEAQVGPDERNPDRQVTYFVNVKGQKVIKKIHPGFLVVLSRSFDLAKSIVRAINDEQETIQVADDALGHTRVVQTTEKAREELGMDAHSFANEFMRLPEVRQTTGELSPSLELSRPRDQFYRDLFFIRAHYVYIDALNQLTKNRAKEGREVTQHEKDILGEKIAKKMEQKVDELRHVNSILDSELDVFPKDIHTVIDMAGGAGDLGLAVTNEFLSLGRDISRTEIVDPQEGVADFMETIIDYLPFRKQLEKIAVHNTGYLQDAHITPDSIVVAKHACGTLTDAILEQWRDSDSKSKVLIAMTCCQGKAKGKPTRYGFTQKEWDRLCEESDLTNTPVPDAPGKARDRALERLERGNRAMKKLDMARVEDLRRLGFKATLSTTDKFPKGDVIVARRLPENFILVLGAFQDLEKNDPLAFDAQMMRLDILAVGHELSDEEKRFFGETWIADDFAELTRRFIAPAFEASAMVNTTEQIQTPSSPDSEKNIKELKQARMREVFADVNGRIDLYLAQRVKKTGKTMDGSAKKAAFQAIQNRLFRDPAESSQAIRSSIDQMMEEMGY